MSEIDLSHLDQKNICLVRTIVTPLWAINTSLSLLCHSAVSLPLISLDTVFTGVMKLLWLLRLCVEVNSKTFCNYILWPLTLEKQSGFPAATIL